MSSKYETPNPWLLDHEGIFYHKLACMHGDPGVRTWSSQTDTEFRRGHCDQHPPCEHMNITILFFFLCNAFNFWDSTCEGWCLVVTLPTPFDPLHRSQEKKETTTNNQSHPPPPSHSSDLNGMAPYTGKIKEEVRL